MKLVAALHLAVAKLVAQPAGYRRVGTADAVGQLCVRSVRRKPERGLVVVYRTRLINPPDWTMVTAIVSEEAMSSGGLAERLAALQPKEWLGRWPGMVRCPGAGLRVQVFPADAELPALAVATDLAGGSALHAALTAAAGALGNEAPTRLWSAEAEVIRYRPGARCVVRYRVSTGGGRRAPLNDDRHYVFFGKLYRQRSVALAAHDLAARLWQVTAAGGPAYLPRPVGVLAEVALVLSAGAGSQRRPAIGGKMVLRPTAGSAGYDGLRTAAKALAWWHSAAVDAGPRAARTAATESDRARTRVDVLAAAIGDVDGARRVGDELLSALARTDVARLRLVHGAFRPNQLVFLGPFEAAITDLDGAGEGDPAVDVGGFLAHLRPPGFWFGRADQRAWSDAASTAFKDSYIHAMIGAGAAPSEIDAVLRRASLFEASAILKIAGHRTRRLSSARPREVAAMLTEASICVGRYHAWHGDRG